MDAVLNASRVVVPGTVRLPLSRGDYVVVKQRLNAGETMDLFERAAPDLDGILNPRKVGMAITTTYLLDWSLTDPEGAVIPIRGASAAEIEAAIRLLDFDSVMEIQRAITAHDAASRQEKKLPPNDERAS